MMERTQRPLELILARNLLTSLSTPAFLVDEGGAMLFYNEAAGALLGTSFEELGRMSADEWGEVFGPFDDEGKQIPLEELPTTKALRRGQPTIDFSTIRSAKGVSHRVAVSALPIVADTGQEGAMVFFWPQDAESG
ncbi:MAG: hypothetical protein EXQ70_07660 [Solirubrobacterales bacterium]|nr:hypothetical protein [Solirubrobacterales bacterium]